MVKNKVLTPVLAGVLGLSIVGSGLGYYFVNKDSNSPDCTCNRGADGICCYQKAFNEISEMVRNKLDTYTFAELIANSEEFNREDTANETQQEIQA